MHMANNKSVIDSWSQYSEKESESFGDEGDFSRQFILTDTIFDLLGNIKGKKVLDAGCGTGYLSRKLAQKGALVTGVEPAEGLSQFCFKKEQKQKLGIEYLQKDLSKLTGFDQKFDVIISNMVFMDIPDYKKAIKNCIKALKKSGIFVFSISHPAFPGSDSDWQKQGFVKITNYFDPQPTKERFGFTFERPISEYVNFAIDSECILEKIVEPRLSNKVLKKYPNATRNYYVPQFIFFKFRKK